MGFGQAFSTCMRKYADFSGRARRSEYWWFYLAYCLILTPFFIAIFIAFIAAAEDLIDIAEDGTTITNQMVIDNVDWEQLVEPGLLFGAVWLALVVPLLAATARRLHDMGLSAFFILVSLVPYVGSAALLVMCILDSQPHENKWGPDPKADQRQLWGQYREAPPPLGG